MPLFVVLALSALGCGEEPPRRSSDGGASGADAATLPPDAALVDAGRDAAMPDSGPRVVSCASAPVMVMPSCPAFTPCGGTLDGTYCYTGSCIEEDELLGEVAFPCARRDFTLTGFTGTVQGQIRFDGTTTSRVASTHLEGTIAVTGVCADTRTSCSSLESGIRDRLPPGATVDCTVSGLSCSCDLVLDGSVDGMESYTLMGSTIAVSSTPARTYAYCVEGGALRFRDTTTPDAEAGVQSASLAP